MKNKIFLSAVTFWTILFFSLGAGFAAAGFPEEKIRLVVPFSPGGGADLVGRTLAQYANPHLGGKIYVENVPGAGGAIGFREGAKAAPDG